MKRLYEIIYLAVFSTVLWIPFMRPNHVTETILKSTDMAAHLAVATGQSDFILYKGQMILPLIFRGVVDSPNLDTYYLAFNFAVLTLAVLAIYFLLNKVVNKQAAIISVPLMTFVFTGIFSLFQYGVIFNIINAYIILPIAMWLIIEWFSGGRWWYGVGAIVSSGVFLIFHATGIYLVFTGVLGLAVYFGYSFYKREFTHYIKVIIIIVAAIIGCVVFIFAYRWRPIEIGGFSLNTLRLLYLHMSIYGVVLCIFGVGYIKAQKLEIGVKTRILFYLVGLFAIVLIISLVMMITENFNRLAIDLSSMIAIDTVAALGIAWKSKKYLPKIVTSVVITAAAIPNLIYWVRL